MTQQVELLKNWLIDLEMMCTRKPKYIFGLEKSKEEEKTFQINLGLEGQKEEIDSEINSIISLHHFASV